MANVRQGGRTRRAPSSAWRRDMASEDRHPVPDPEADPSDPGCELVAEAPPPREIDPTTHYDLSLRIDEMFGPPRLPCGDDLLEYRRIEDSMAERWFKNDDPRIQFDIRCWCMALFEARRYERLRQDLLVEQMALEIVIALPSYDKPEFKCLKED